jgi:hypothetical protein
MTQHNVWQSVTFYCYTEGANAECCYIERHYGECPGHKVVVRLVSNRSINKKNRKTFSIMVCRMSHTIVMLSAVMWMSLCWMPLCWMWWRPRRTKNFKVFQKNLSAFPQWCLFMVSNFKILPSKWPLRAAILNFKLMHFHCQTIVCNKLACFYKDLTHLRE